MKGDIEQLESLLKTYDGPPIRLMEVCGTHTHAIAQLGIPALLSPNIGLISGPGCPVCVTPAGYIDRAVELALSPDNTVLSFGDLMRVPGSGGMSLTKAVAEGGSVALMYSPLEVIARAVREPDRMFTVTAVGFETTLPVYALLIQKLMALRVKNVRLLTALKALMPALEWICEHEPDVDGFIGPGHVSVILGKDAYAPLCAKRRIPLTIAGFQYEQLVAAVADLVIQITEKRHEVHNLYPAAVTDAGNRQAQELCARFFSRGDSVWRGLGGIAQSEYFLREEYAPYDAGRYDGGAGEVEGCLCGSVVTGRARPTDCGFFGRRCTPDNPLGPCMVSSEGSCGIWFTCGRTR